MVESHTEAGDMQQNGLERSDSPYGTKSLHMRFLENVGVSCLSASLSHVPHHPLYTLKSQMMFHGKKFKFSSFFARSIQTKGTFLFQGMMYSHFIIVFIHLYVE